MTAIVSCEGVYQFYAWRGYASSSELKQDTLGFIPRHSWHCGKSLGMKLIFPISFRHTRADDVILVVELFSEGIRLY